MNRYLSLLLKYGKWIALSAFIAIAVLIFFIGLGKSSSNVKCPTTTTALSTAEKKRKLINFLAKVKETKFKMQPHRSFQDVTESTKPEDILKKFLPYDCKPETIKLRTDSAKKLYEESIKLMKMIGDVLNEKELKIMAKLQHYISTNFGAPYDEDYYAGDWMLGPDSDCWQPFCNIPDDLLDNFGVGDNAFRPRSIEGIQFVVDTLDKYKDSVLQYINNMNTGKEVGMIRSQSEKSGALGALQERFPMVIEKGKTGVLLETYVTTLRSSNFFGNLDETTLDVWKTKYGMFPNQSIDDALVNHLGSSLEKLYLYLRDDYFDHCPPNNVNSGLANLPVDFMWVNSTEDKKSPTTKRLPTGELIDGKETYKQILKYFTTFDITPEEINRIAQEKIERLVPIKLNILMTITGENNPEEAEKAFSKNLDNIFYNVDPFPIIESNISRCLDKDASAAKMKCPVRYSKMQEWIQDTRSAVQLILAKTRPLFYFTGEFTTVSNCPIEISADPFSNEATYHHTDASCSEMPCEYTLPFFEENYGPKYETYTSLVQWVGPGFHTLSRALIEHFPGDYDEGEENIEWLDDEMDKMSYSNGWMEYTDFVLMALQSDLYDSDLLQRYGVIQKEIEGAVRLLIDTGVHYLGMTSNEATSLWLKHSSHVSNKEMDAKANVAHIQNRPGLAAGYHLGHHIFWKVRNATEKLLESSGYHFDVRVYHHNVLQLGAVPLSYLKEYTERITGCMINVKHHTNCMEIFGEEFYGQERQKMGRRPALKAKKYNEHEFRNDL